MKFSLTDDKTWKKKRIREKDVKVILEEEISENRIEKLFEDYSFEVDKYSFSGDYVEICSVDAHKIDSEDLKDEENGKWEIEDNDLGSYNNYKIDRENYGEEENSGKNIEFIVTINVIINIATPKLTDDYVKEVYSYLGLSTVEEYKEEFYAEIYYTVIDEMQHDIVVEYIAEAEDLSVTEEEYQKELEKTMMVYDIETEEEFYDYFEVYGYDKEFFMKNFLANIVVEFICDNVVME